MRRTIRLEGGGGLEEIPARDIARLIDAVVRATARAAGHALGRQVRPTGRWRNAVNRAAEVRLVELSSGSGVLTFQAAPDATPDLIAFPWSDGPLGERALEIAIDAAGPQAEQFPDVASEWAHLARDLGVGRRYDRVLIETEEIEPVSIDRETMDQLEAAASRQVSPVEATGVQGRVYEANFDNRTALLKGAGGETVRVDYPEPLADDVYRVLRGTANLVGDVTYDSETMRATSIQVQRVDRPQQITFEDFWERRPISLIAEEAGLRPVQDPNDLVIHGLSPADWAELREGMGR